LLTFSLASLKGIFWLVAALIVLAGTAYWLRHARRGPNRDCELMGLIGFFAILADFLIILYASFVASTELRP
jgi:uncharacterized membrane protein YdfJ with MMPL/SSD domain